MTDRRRHNPLVGPTPVEWLGNYDVLNEAHSTVLRASGRCSSGRFARHIFMCCHIHVLSKHMKSYLDEFTWRWNHRMMKNAMFDLLISRVSQPARFRPLLHFPLDAIAGFADPSVLLSGEFI